MKIYEKYLVDGRNPVFRGAYQTVSGKGDSKKLNQDIQRIKKKLINKWKREGPYENFGQKEVGGLEDKYDTSDKQQAKLIRDFSNWCMNYTG